MSDGGGLARRRDPVGRLLDAIERGTVVPPGLFDAEAVLDATVPNWRYTRYGEEAVRETMAEWYCHRGTLESLSRTPLPAGELVEFTFHWEEDGVAHAAHQIHVLTLDGGRIVADTVFCGGRWPAPLLACEAGAPACAWPPPAPVR
jgi:ketosteroid isomerase-like protein